MKREKKDIVQANLPAPIALTLEELNAVANDTAAMLGTGGGVVLHIYGGIQVPT
jgi:hypothetical protein